MGSFDIIVLHKGLGGRLRLRYDQGKNSCGDGCNGLKGPFNTLRHTTVSSRRVVHGSFVHRARVVHVL